MGSSLPSQRFTMDLAYERGIFIFTFKPVLCLYESKKTCFRKQGWRDRSGINFQLSDERNHRLVNLGRQDNLAVLRKAKREGAKNSSTYLRTLKMWEGQSSKLQLNQPEPEGSVKAFKYSRNRTLKVRNSIRTSFENKTENHTMPGIYSACSIGYMQGLQ